jgi:hypothetical protein
MTDISKLEAELNDFDGGNPASGALKVIIAP